MQAEFRYKAFLSYSHKDQKAATRFHRALEGYRLPKHVTDKSKAGATHDRLGRIFRDRDELPAAEDLTAEVKKALATSEFMIVLCSPRAAASRWVNKEVIEFKKLRGDAFVLPVILKGEPGASANELEADAEECFPPAVRFKLGANGRLSRKLAEPVAADMRKSGDGHHRALLKVVAGLLGVGLDQLIEREMQRKQRRVIAVTAASMLGMLVMSALTFQAVTAQREAEYNRAQAEDLVEFMLTDLRKKLDAVGRLDALDSVGEKAVEYYDAQPVESLEDNSVGRRARAFHLLGEVEELRGDLAGAETMFDRAKGATAALLARNPNDPQRIFDHSQSVFWTGYMDIQHGDFEAALAAMRLYKDYSEQLVALDSDNPDWQMELSYAYGNMGALQLWNLDQPRKAYENYEAAGIIIEKLIEDNPDNLTLQFSLADTYAWIADALRHFGHADETIAARKKQQKILEKILKKDPKHKSAMRQLSNSYTAQGWIAYYRQDKAALSLFEKTTSIFDGLTANDPENKYWQHLLASHHMRLAKAYHLFDQHNKAELAYTKSKQLAATITQDDETTITRYISSRLYTPFVGLQLQAERSGFSNVLDGAQQLLNIATEGKLDVIGHVSGKRMVGEIYLIIIKSLQANGDNAKAHYILDQLWSGSSVLGTLQFNAEQDPRWVNILAEIAFLRGDTELLASLKTGIEKRGYSIFF